MPAMAGGTQANTPGGGGVSEWAEAVPQGGEEEEGWSDWIIARNHTTVQFKKAFPTKPGGGGGGGKQPCPVAK